MPGLQTECVHDYPRPPKLERACVAIRVIFGGHEIVKTDDALRVAPDPERLALHGVTLQQLAAKGEGANSAAPAGSGSSSSRSRSSMPSPKG